MVVQLSPEEVGRMRTRPLPAAVLGCSLLLGSCAAVVGDDVACQADYPRYRDVAELVGDSDLVVVAVPGRQELRSVDVGGGTVVDVRVWPLEVDRVLGEPRASDTQFEVKLMECLDVLGLAEGERHLLFLRTFPDVPGMPASMLSPEQGQYRFDDSDELVPVEGNDLRVRLAEVDRLVGSSRS